jgi:hypothetical protein
MVSLIIWPIRGLLFIFPVLTAVDIMEEITHMPANAANNTFSIIINLRFYKNPRPRVKGLLS